MQFLRGSAIPRLPILSNHVQLYGFNKGTNYKVFVYFKIKADNGLYIMFIISSDLQQYALVVRAHYIHKKNYTCEIFKRVYIITVENVIKLIHNIFKIQTH